MLVEEALQVTPGLNYARRCGSRSFLLSDYIRAAQCGIAFKWAQYKQVSRLFNKLHNLTKSWKRNAL